MQRVNNIKLKYFRHLAVMVFSAMFIHRVVQLVIQYNERKTMLSQSTRMASRVIYPSVTMCPVYKHEFALSKTSGTKNLTEYYESLHSRSLIKDRIISISQPYKTENGCGTFRILVTNEYHNNFTYRGSSHIFLNNSNYDLHPDVVSTLMTPNLALYLMRGIRDGIQECVTYNPPGPTTPGVFYPVRL